MPRNFWIFLFGVKKIPWPKRMDGYSWLHSLTHTDAHARTHTRTWQTQWNSGQCGRILDQRRPRTCGQTPQVGLILQLHHTAINGERIGNTSFVCHRLGKESSQVSGVPSIPLLTYLRGSTLVKPVSHYPTQNLGHFSINGWKKVSKFLPGAFGF